MNSPFVMVIFGGTGDLARNKLIPALFSLFKKNQLGKEVFIIGFARRTFTDEEYRGLVYETVNQYHKDNKGWEEFAKNIYYQQGLFDEKRGYEELIDRLNKFDQKIGACITRLFYLATPPDNYETILNFLDKSKLSEGCGPASAYLASRSSSIQARGALAGKHGFSKWTRVIIEKPFGKDLETAKALDKKLAKIFEEHQIFRVDHYLGKETVQNILTFRFANGIFEPIWNKNYIDHVQITLAESKGIGTRGKFFDGVGLLRDVAQSHLMQLIAAVCMEQPKSFSKEAVRDTRAAAIKSIRCIEPRDVQKFVVRGQYVGYKDEKDVEKDSNTETFVTMKLFVDTPKFENVPFYIRAGKKMPKDIVEISIVFTQTCHLLFREYGCPEEGNILRIRIQPDEGIGFRVIAKKPGSKLSLEAVDMKFSYKEEFGEKVSDAYEKILLDIFAGDQMLFNRSDELSSSWTFITKILAGWQRKKSGITTYESGTWGPKGAKELIEKDNRKWL